MDEQDSRLLRRTFELGRQTREQGNPPFGALLADPDGRVLLEDANTAVTTRDCTAHAEASLLRTASVRFERDFLRGCTLFASGEPCAMCAAAMVWSGVGRLVFGLGSARLYELKGEPTPEPSLKISCREIFARAMPQVEVVGPVLEAEAEAVHEGWHSRPG